VKFKDKVNADIKGINTTIGNLRNGNKKTKKKHKKEEEGAGSDGSDNQS